MDFHVLLNECLAAHKLKAADIHRKTGLKRPYISKVLSGDLIPSSYSIVEDIMNAAELELDERAALTDAYYMIRSSGESRKIWRAFKKLYTHKYPKLPKSTPEHKDIPNASILSGRELSDAITVIMKESSGETILFYSPVIGESAKRLCGGFAAMPEDAGLKWIMPFNPSGRGGIVNFTILANSLGLICIRSCAVIKTEADIALLLKNHVFPFFLLSGGRLLLFDEKVQSGQYFDDPAIIEIYSKKFIGGRILNKPPFLRTFDNSVKTMEFFSTELVSGFGSEYDYYTIANVPCIIFEVSEKEISEFAVDNGNDNAVSSMYFKYLNSILSSARKCTDIFSYYGLIDYLDKEEWYEIGKHFSKNLDRDFRRTAVKNSIEQSAANVNFDSLGLKIPGFNRYSLIGANVVSSGFVILGYEFEEKTVIAAVMDKDISDMLIRCINEMIKHGLIAGKEETTEYVTAELKKRLSPDA